MEREHIAVLSHLVARAHNEGTGNVAVFANSLENVPQQGTLLVDGKKMVFVEGRRLKVKADVRGLLRKVDREIQDSERFVLWTSFDKEENVSSVGVAQWFGEDEPFEAVDSEHVVELQVS